jgi:BirA family biotin operon repressor/biotin-[acetyl-CoA-carboxylase] ligase
LIAEAWAAATPVLRFDALGSTNAEARRRAEAGEGGPLWIAADRQTAGRGRRGRNWETGAGNLAATLLLSTDRPPIDAALISFATALAVFDLAADWVPETLLALKWPNDVLLAGRKVSGVLIESGRGADGRLWLAVGVGVNLKTPPEAPERPAAALAEHLRADRASPPTPEAALDRLDAALRRWLAVWDEEGAAALLSAWRSRAGGMGAPCAVRLDQEQIDGIAEGLDPDGALRLRLPDGTIRRITAGDVFFPEAAQRPQETR